MPNFKFDRRPRFFCATSNLENNTWDPRDLGRSRAFLTQGLTLAWTYALIGRNLGFEVPLLWMLQGNPRGQTLYSSAFWNTLDPGVRDQFSRIPKWVTEFDLYTGFTIDATCNPNSLHMGTTHVPNLTHPKDAAFWSANYNPIHNLLTKQSKSLTTVWFDTASGFPNDLATLSTQEKRFRCGGEALPWVDVGPGPGPGGRVYSLDPTYITLNPWFTTYSAFLTFQTGSPTAPWSVNPATTECHICIQDIDSPTLPDLQDLVSRGFILDGMCFNSTTVNTNIITAQA